MASRKRRYPVVWLSSRKSAPKYRIKRAFAGIALAQRLQHKHTESQRGESPRPPTLDHITTENITTTL
jgi:hypothetical protein